MMHEPLVAGTDFDRFQPSRSMHRRPEHKIPVRVARARREQIRFLGPHDYVRLPQLPAGRKTRLGGKVYRVAFDFTLIHPRLNSRDFRLRQAQFVCKLQIAGLRQPWRHDVFAGDKGNLPSMGFHIGVAQKRERPRLTWMMALRAISKHNRSNIAVERDLRLRRRGFGGRLPRRRCMARGKPGGRHGEHKQNSNKSLRRASHSRSEM